MKHDIVEKDERKLFRVTYTAYVRAENADEAGENMLDCGGDFDTEVVEVDEDRNEVDWTKED